MIIFNPDDEGSKAFAEAYYDGSQELSFLGKEVIVAKDEDEGEEMRELKFRVWYENVKRGEKEGDEIVWSTKSYYDYNPIIDNGGLLEVEGGWDIYGNSDENYVIEQYTGIKDKNGKEIYEGDIVQTDRGARGIGWNNEYSRFGIHESRDGFYAFCKLSNFEVIGNIHENPELLGGEEEE